MTEWQMSTECGFVEWRADAGLFSLFVTAERNEMTGCWRMCWLLHLAGDHAFEKGDWESVNFNDIPRRAPLLAGDCVEAAEQAWRRTAVGLEGLRS